MVVVVVVVFACEPVGAWVEGKEKVCRQSCLKAVVVGGLVVWVVSMLALVVVVENVGGKWDLLV